jgi:dihydropteroate synthase
VAHRGGREPGGAARILEHGCYQRLQIILRVHDVAEMTQVARAADCVLDPKLAPRN